MQIAILKILLQIYLVSANFCATLPPKAAITNTPTDVSCPVTAKYPPMSKDMKLITLIQDTSELEEKQAWISFIS